MKKNIINRCLQTAKLLLCLFVFYCSSCKSLRRFDQGALETSKPILQVAVRESDLPFFIEKIQELNLVPIDFQQRMPDTQNGETKEFWITFRFFTKNAFLVGRSEIMTTGLVSKIIH
ncbi:hypothetical protein [Pedobacter sp. Hv1]|uniref:hypothetical protein n=1 Tax=Pedobacter sp. Hv1 TaxID=1740090 RepID=UPI0006D8A716|nr:hypothetical protein [Pedobacter sp. Hv1]KQC02045.1 hypothetical protein AQF98_00280 [Pedobacter sp. Hv1]